MTNVSNLTAAQKRIIRLLASCENIGRPSHDTLDGLVNAGLITHERYAMGKSYWELTETGRSTDIAKKIIAKRQTC